MTSSIADISPRKTAIAAGLIYLICVVLGLFAIAYVRGSLVVPGDAATTVSNILDNETLFRTGILVDLLFLTIWLLLPLALYKLFKPVNEIAAVLMVVFALAMVPIMFMNDVFYFAALVLLSGADYLAVFDTGQLHALAVFFLDLQSHGYDMTMIFHGLWLAPFGYLVFKSGSVYKAGLVAKILGVWLMLGCLGYLIDWTTFILLPDFEVQFALLANVEVLMPFWLLFMAGKPLPVAASSD
jgi:hypothetical protein